jgi:hypothetical protein
MILSACLFYMDLVIIPQSKSLSEIGERPNMLTIEIALNDSTTQKH